MLIFCISKTVIPMQLAWDKYGYDAFWFVALYLTGTYIRRYELPLIDSRRRAAALYIGSALIIFASFVVIRQVYFATGSFADFINYGYSYNYLFCYLGAIGLFMAFRQIRLPECLRKPIELISGASFGVYLIHEHVNIRYLWVEWFDCRAFTQAPPALFLGHMLLTVLAVYMVCTLIELVRKRACFLIRKK